MPEYAEVYCLVKDLQVVVGSTINDFWAIDTNRFPMLPINGYTITEVNQSGKVIVISVTKKKEVRYLNIHLGMTGEFGLERELLINLKGLITLKDGRKLYLRDHRGFGCWYLNIDYCPLGKREVMGSGFKIEVMDSLVEKNVPIYALLINQNIFPGVGSYLAQEALFQAGLDPRKKFLKSAEVSFLIKQLKIMVRKAIKAGGATMANYRRLDGSKGNFQKHFKVYRRAGLPCLVCKVGFIEKITIYNRSVYYCSECQST